MTGHGVFSGRAFGHATVGAPETVPLHRRDPREAQARQVGQGEADRFENVSDGIGALVTELRRVGSIPNTDRIEDNQGHATEEKRTHTGNSIS